MSAEPIGASPGDTSAPVVQLDGIGKRFGAVTAVEDITFAVRPGELFGLIGPDGAGKTTLLRIVTSLVVPDVGSARVLGLDPVREHRALRQRLGYMPGRFALYQDLSTAENLAFYASVFGTSVADGLHHIEPIWRQLAPFADRRAGALSGGMKQKLALCCALVHAPALLVLDEPTTGVDAVSRTEFWELLGRLRDDGLGLLVSTPYMDEARRCDRVALMQAGRVLALDTPTALARAYPEPLFAVRGPDRLSLLAVLRALPHTASVWPFGEQLHYADRRRDVPVPVLQDALETALQQAGVPEARVTPIAAGVEDVFLRLAEAA